jgi:diadenosine tetraphosphate (Ap4A) HIT family hydrolase
MSRDGEISGLILTIVVFVASGWRHGICMDMAKTTDPNPCGICRLHADASDLAQALIWEDSRWLLRHHPLPAPLAGWCLLDAKRHLGGPIDFIEGEASEWGPVVQRACSLVKQVSGCDRVYVIGFGEGARHLHLHLVPRHAADRRTAAWSIADLYRHVESGHQLPADPSAVEEFVGEARHRALLGLR